jgi:endonuclease YncB( thermonuclease family)
MNRLFYVAAVLLSFGVITANAQIIDPTGQSTRTQQVAEQSAARNRIENAMPGAPGPQRITNSTALERAKREMFRKNVLATFKQQELKVDKVIDGDTFEVVDDKNRRLVLRVAGIDAPEEGQENWEAAKGHLNDMISGKTVTVKFSTFCPRHVKGFFIVHVSVDKADVGSYMLSNGWAWYDKTYGVFFTEKEDEENNKAMKKARSAKLGIWSNPKAEEPWEYFEKAQKEKTTK